MPEAGDELIEIFREVGDFVMERRPDWVAIKQKAPLGDGPAGEARTDFDQQVAAEEVIVRTRTSWCSCENVCRG